MKPDKAIIYFTVCSGTGYGIILSLITIFYENYTYIQFEVKFLIALLSFALIFSGLIASTIHLGHPERAWRALSQWKSSWLSREGVSAIFTFFPIFLFYFFWIFTDKIYLTYFLLIINIIWVLVNLLR